MDSIIEVFERLYQENGKDVEAADESFREEMKEDPALKELYISWCDEMGYTERKGFRSYFLNKSESENIWDSIFPNKEEYDGYDFDK